MNRNIRQFSLVVSIGVLAAACSTTPPPSPPALHPAPNAGVYRVGKPYKIGSTWYYPHEQPNYDETGIASWYGPGFYGRLTSDGEIYTGQQLTAAHKTLPLPVNVRVTNLENGRSMILRVNDRGPFARGRIIDVSESAAKSLGFYQQGTAKVRVQYLGRADLPDGQPQPFGADTPAAIATAAKPAAQIGVQSGQLAQLPGSREERNTATRTPAKPVRNDSADVANRIRPNGQVSLVPVPAKSEIYVQLGAFSNYQNARKLMFSYSGGAHIYPYLSNGTTFYRVRLGPFQTVDSADDALDAAQNNGQPDARIVIDQ